MKRPVLALIAFLTFNLCAKAQNTSPWPSTGNVGIGTTSPLSLFSVGSSSQFQINASGLVSITNTIPEHRFVTLDGNYARFLRSQAASNNLFTGNNWLVQAGTVGNAVNLFGAGAQYSGSDAGLPSGSSITLSVSVWLKGNGTVPLGAIFCYGSGSSSINFLIGGGTATDMFLGQAGIVSSGGYFPVDNNWHHLVVVVNGSSLVAYVDGVASLGGTVTYNPVVLSGTLSSPYAVGGNRGTNATFDQMLIYNRALSSTEVSSIYNSGAGTGGPPTTGLIRRYEFDEGTGATVADNNPTGTAYPLTLSAYSWNLAGKVSVPTTPSESTFFSSRDGLTNGEKGIATWGDAAGRNQQQGKWFQWVQTGKYPLVSNNSGQWLFNPNNTSATLPTVASTVDVAGNMTVGSGYAGTNAAPKDGLIVQGNVGIGTTVPAFPLQINQALNGQGTIAVTAGSGTITGTGTNFLADFWIGDVINANGETRTITAIPSATSMTTDNWTNTFSGGYTTSNTQRYAFSGKGELYLGDPQGIFTNDGFIQIGKSFTNNSALGRGFVLNMNSAQTIAPTSTGLNGITGIVGVNSSNTQNWTSLSGLNGVLAQAIIRLNASGTITGATGVSSSVNNNSTAAILTNAYAFKGSVVGTGPITNATGTFLYGLGHATNNTGIYLDINSSLPAPPTGNWGIYDNTGYNNYFAGNMIIGTNAMPAGYKFAVAGGAVAESMTVKLQANWPDYTFKKGYKLMPLAELKTYVDKNRHLPEIPSAAQVEKDGINLGEMNRLLLKKVEELTLYLIEKDKEMKLLEDRLQKLENKQKQ